MPFTLNTSQDYQWVANRESVTLRNQDNSVNQTVADAKRLMQGLNERAVSDGNYLRVPIDFRLPAVNVSFSISPGWFILDLDNVSYVVLSVNPPGTYNGTWNCACQALMVMGDEVDWRQVNQTTDPYGDRVSDPATFPLAGHFICWIQPITVTDTDILAKRGYVERFTVFMLDEPNLSYGDLFIDGDNVTYKVVSWQSRQNLDSAMEVTVEIQP